MKTDIQETASTAVFLLVFPTNDHMDHGKTYAAQRL